MTKTVQMVQGRDYQGARSSIENFLDPEGDDRLLYHMELGTLEYLDGKYGQSIDHFNTAEIIAEELYTTRSDEFLSSMLLNPRQRDYAGLAFERVYINYYKALNFLSLFEGASREKEKKDYLEKARVEIRRLDFKLYSRDFEKGSYQELNDKKKKLFARLLDFFARLQGQWVDEDWLVFREDAYARYLSGVLYEINGEVENARISYQKAAKLYEQGYSKQYDLDPAIEEQAWLNTIRMMQSSGGWEEEWQRLAKERLSGKKRDELEDYAEKDAHIIVIEHLGNVPRRKELNLRLWANAEKKSLILDPVLLGSRQEMRDQMSWFFLMYADKGVLDIVKNYAYGGLYDAARGFGSKIVPLGPAWDVAESLLIPQTLGSFGIRVTVPYYSPLRSKWGQSKISWDGREKSLLRAESIAQMALQNQLFTAGHDLRVALARAVVKNIAAVEAGRALGEEVIGNEMWGVFFKLLGKGLASGSSAAETRNWLLLPREIRVARIPVQAGKHTLTLKTYLDSGGLHESTSRSFELDPGEIKVWIHRTM
ncbi:MAG: hypothetical protein ACOCZ2_05375 [Thermodesulfobacteriota bacterium]